MTGTWRCAGRPGRLTAPRDKGDDVRPAQALHADAGGGGAGGVRGRVQQRQRLLHRGRRGHARSGARRAGATWTLHVACCHISGASSLGPTAMHCSMA